MSDVAYPNLAYGDAPMLPTCAAGKLHVTFCLTPYAPDCDVRAITDPQRWPTFWSVTPRQGLARVLSLLRRTAGEVSVKALAAGESALLVAGPARPLAFCWDLTAQQLETARAELARGVAP